MLHADCRHTSQAIAGQKALQQPTMNACSCPAGKRNSRLWCRRQQLACMPCLSLAARPWWKEGNSMPYRHALSTPALKTYTVRMFGIAMAQHSPPVHEGCMRGRPPSAPDSAAGAGNAACAHPPRGLHVGNTSTHSPSSITPSRRCQSPARPRAPSKVRLGHMHVNLRCIIPLCQGAIWICARAHALLFPFGYNPCQQ